MAAEHEPWHLIDPDPGTLSQLCTRMGTQGVQVEQVQALTQDAFRDQKPVYGIILLLRHRPEVAPKDESATGANADIYFANQVAHDAYAIQAILNVLMNCDSTVEIGPDLTHFKEFTREFSPVMKGLSLTNSKVLKDAHNSVASHWPAMRRLARGEEIFHAISYIPVNGYLWELDGFKKSPLRLAPYTTEIHWLELVRSELLRKTDIFQRQQVPFSVWSVIEDRRRVCQRRLVARKYLKSSIESQLDKYHPDWRVTIALSQWEEEYKHAMDDENLQRGRAVSLHLLTTYCQSIEDLPAPERADVRAQWESEVRGRTMDELTDLWLQIQDDCLRLYSRLGDEDEKRSHYQKNTTRRQHDYTPFVKSFISHLVVSGHLQRLVSDIS